MIREGLKPSKDTEKGIPKIAIINLLGLFEFTQPMANGSQKCSSVAPMHYGLILPHLAHLQQHLSNLCLMHLPGQMPFEQKRCEISQLHSLSRGYSCRTSSIPVNAQFLLCWILKAVGILAPRTSRQELEEVVFRSSKTFLSPKRHSSPENGRIEQRDQRFPRAEASSWHLRPLSFFYRKLSNGESRYARIESFLLSSLPLSFLMMIEFLTTSTLALNRQGFTQTSTSCNSRNL